MCWVAKNQLTNEILSKEYDSIYKCQEFIDTKCVILNYLGRLILAQQDSIQNKFCIRSGNIVRCWNTTQNRWCDGFDF